MTPIIEPIFPDPKKEETNPFSYVTSDGRPITAAKVKKIKN